MEKSLRDEVRAKFVLQLRQRIKQRSEECLEPSSAIPGSPEKIALLAARVNRAEALGVEFPLHHPQDAKMPLGMGWRIKIGANGRIIHKELVSQDQSNVQEIARQEALSVLEQVREMVGRRWADATKRRLSDDDKARTS